MRFERRHPTEAATFPGNTAHTYARHLFPVERAGIGEMGRSDIAPRGRELLAARDEREEFLKDKGKPSPRKKRTEVEGRLLVGRTYYRILNDGGRNCC